MNSGLYSGRFSHNPIDGEYEYGLLQQDELTAHAYSISMSALRNVFGGHYS